MISSTHSPGLDLEPPDDRSGQPESVDDESASCTFNFVTVSLNNSCRVSRSNAIEEPMNQSQLHQYSSCDASLAHVNLKDLFANYTVNGIEVKCRTHPVIAPTFPAYSSNPNGGKYHSKNVIAALTKTFVIQVAELCKLYSYLLQLHSCFGVCFRPHDKAMFGLCSKWEGSMDKGTHVQFT